MDEIINQIIAIDSEVYEDKKNKDNMLQSKRDEYERQIDQFNVDKLKKANEEALEILADAQKKVDEQNNVLSTKKLEIQNSMEQRYTDVKDLLLNNVMNKLFVME